jgi:hypothetical protein
MTGLPPSEVAADHVRPTMPDVVTAALLAKDRGAVGTEAAITSTSDESAPKPTKLRALTLKV